MHLGKAALQRHQQSSTDCSESDQPLCGPALFAQIAGCAVRSQSALESGRLAADGAASVGTLSLVEARHVHADHPRHLVCPARGDSPALSGSAASDQTGPAWAVTTSVRAAAPMSSSSSVPSCVTQNSRSGGRWLYRAVAVIRQYGAAGPQPSRQIEGGMLSPVIPCAWMVVCFSTPAAYPRGSTKRRSNGARQNRAFHDATLGLWYPPTHCGAEGRTVCTLVPTTA